MAHRSSLSRRHFVVQATLATAAWAVGDHSNCSAASKERSRFPIIGFSKPFQKLTADETAELVEEVGWDGIEIPVRNKGQIEPERAADELPRFAEALRRRNRDIFLVATDIVSLKTPHCELVLRTIAKLGIKRLRLGFVSYPNDRSPAEWLRQLAPELKEIATACGDLGLQAGFQNHSGARSVGAPVWDVYSMIKDLDPRKIGFCFDIGHATVEGGLSWPVEARLAEPFLTAVFVKDFYWKKEGRGWKDAWCPLGEGMVNRAFFDWLKTTNYAGPICQHHEYELGDAKQRLAHFQADLAVLKSWLA
ncbi:MAG: sugar phosphate isomerase/epimerase family protein [Verrucomicrobiota bacterium]